MSAVSDITAKERRHIGRISGGSRLLAELAVDAISLRRLNADAPKPCLYRSVHELVLRHGWLFKPRPFPAKHRKWRGEPHDCLLNALRLAVGAPGLAYVEGFALPAKGILQRPVAHSWCADADGNVVDPTWHGRPGEEYCGLSLDKRLLHLSHLRSKPFGIVFNEPFFTEVAAGRQDWRKLLAPGACGFLPERELPS